MDPTPEGRLIRIALNRLSAFQSSAPASPMSEPTDSRPRLAYFSPLSPQETGIAAYSAELLPELAAYYRVDVIVENPAEVDGHNSYRVRDFEWVEQHAQEYDRFLYQIGNSHFHARMLNLLERYPGTIVLHDFYLSGLLHAAEKTVSEKLWLRSLLYCHGYLAAAEGTTTGNDAEIAHKYPMNRAVLEAAQGIIVHSEHAKKLARDFFDESFSARWTVIRPFAALPELKDHGTSKRALGFDESAFIVCAFGWIGETKLNHVLLQAWLNSEFSRDPNCHLVFVGGLPDAPYGALLKEMISSSDARERIKVTGFVPRSVYETYLGATDLAVQLRTSSRGETSAAVKDCMSHGVPVIVNAHGAMSELPSETVLMLPDKCTTADLVSAITALRHDSALRHSLGTAARDFLKTNAPLQRAASLYASAIERFSMNAVPFFDPQALHCRAQELKGRPRDEWINSARKLIRESEIKPAKRQLLVDVSIIAINDYKTGIQRVVRSQLMELLKSPPFGFHVEPVRMLNDRGAWRYFYARSYACKLLSLPEDIFDDEPVEVGKGDILLVSDFYAHGVIEATKQGLFEEWRARGVSINVVIYDLLPILLPQCFPSHMDDVHQEWLLSVAKGADRLICISQAVANDARKWLSTFRPDLSEAVEICSVPLGADIEASAPTSGVPPEAALLLDKIEASPTFLMVGTVEPRKQHLQVLAAFRELWSKGMDVKLIIAGSEGWVDVSPAERRTIPAVVMAIQDTPELGTRLFWLRGISDEFLKEVYKRSACLIAASLNEGFGLPLIEAARHGTPILARDIPAFREIGKDHISYFRGLSGHELAHAVENWLQLHAADKHPKPGGICWLTWAESVEQMKGKLLSHEERFEFGEAH